MALSSAAPRSTPRLTGLLTEAAGGAAATVFLGGEAGVGKSRLLEEFAAGTGAEEMDRSPGGGPAADERVDALLADSAAIDRIASAVVELIADR
ncbi:MULTISPECIES: hypothetical protein [unclassified Micromonospora]|uniref:hypothetical protein n=1 Tax=unclassified Micromonospora TaxID=2617518 RepID=UPI003A8703E1